VNGLRQILAVAMLCCLGTALLRAAEPAAASESQRIEALLDQVGRQADVQFVRNGKAYDATTAAKFLRGKWDRQKAEITTVADFIEKIATKSSTSGQPYRIRFKDGHELDCAQFLKQLLTAP
jgi:hypothetical protein